MYDVRLSHTDNNLSPSLLQFRSWDTDSFISLDIKPILPSHHKYRQMNVWHFNDCVHKLVILLQTTNRLNVKLTYT